MKYTVLALTTLSACCRFYALGFGNDAFVRKNICLRKQSSGKLTALPVQHLHNELPVTHLVGAMGTSSILTSASAEIELDNDMFGLNGLSATQYAPPKPAYDIIKGMSDIGEIDYSSFWSRIDREYKEAHTVEYVQNNPDVLEANEFQMQLISRLPFVGVFFGVALYLMRWANYELNDQTYMSPEEEAQVAVGTTGIFAGILVLTFIAASIATEHYTGIPLDLDGI
mmetsp:Transcript_8525/g.12618  ORF Transcript_8525/g.12618 Transcript_8525/m.12618 type:complete len:226 (-) Transcript_8525:132-809(-)